MKRNRIVLALLTLAILLSGVAFALTSCAGGSPECEAGEHQLVKETKVIDVSGRGLCSDKLVLQSCECGESCGSSGNPCNTEYEILDFDTYTDKKGYEHYIGTAKCPQCSLEMKIDAYSPDEDSTTSCRYTTYNKETYSLNGEVLGEFDYREVQYSHDCLYQFDPTDDCESGYTGVGTCTRCGHSEKVSGDNHDRESKGGFNYMTASIEFPTSEGFCGGALEKYSCGCGKYELLKDWDLPCKFEPVGAEREYTGDDGRTHSVQNYKCKNCPLEKCEDEYWVETLLDVQFFTVTTYKRGDTVYISHTVTRTDKIPLLE